ncbi:MAG: SDH family Clp fold serine proteinase [Pseudonocardiaceae bacterium]
MPSWGELLPELTPVGPNQGPDFDGVRRRYLARLVQLTGRPAVHYTSAWMNGLIQGPDTSIGLQDMQGLMEVFQGVAGPELDLILHSPGGDASAVASLVHYMRSKYSHVRVFVPLAAMSAATMWALAADEIVMGKHSQLGPIDPQLVTPRGAVPTRAVLQDFERAAAECGDDPGKLSAWLPTLQQYYPGMLELCRNAEELARELVRDWLRDHMFAGETDAGEKAEKAAAFFADASRHKSHSRGIFRDEARDYGLKIIDLEVQQELQDAVLTVHHAAMHTVGALPVSKLIENHLGKAFIRQASVIMQAQINPVLPLVPTQPPAPTPTSSEAPPDTTGSRDAPA